MKLPSPRCEHTSSSCLWWADASHTCSHSLFLLLVLSLHSNSPSLPPCLPGFLLLLLLPAFLSSVDSISGLSAVRAARWRSPVWKRRRGLTEEPQPRCCELTHRANNLSHSVSEELTKTTPRSHIYTCTLTDSHLSEETKQAVLTKLIINFNTSRILSTPEHPQKHEDKPQRNTLPPSSGKCL